MKTERQMEVKHMEFFKVTGCGVTLLCQKNQSMLEWLSYIITHGGVPVVERIDMQNGGL